MREGSRKTKHATDKTHKRTRGLELAVASPIVLCFAPCKDGRAFRVALHHRLAVRAGGPRVVVLCARAKQSLLTQRAAGARGAGRGGHALVGNPVDAVTKGVFLEDDPLKHFGEHFWGRCGWRRRVLNAALLALLFRDFPPETFPRQAPEMF